MNALPGLHRVKMPPTRPFLLMDDDGAVLMDCGLIRGVATIGRALRRHGLDWPDLHAILLTHGHLDHVGNLHALKQVVDVPVYAHPAESPIIDGTYSYRGTARFCGALHKLGYAALRYRPVAADVAIEDGQELPFWGGLKVVHLPCHTPGHCGYYSVRHDALFVGDLLASRWWGTHKAPAVFTALPQNVVDSFHRVARIRPTHLLANHADTIDGQLLWRRFERYYQRKFAGR